MKLLPFMLAFSLLILGQDVLNDESILKMVKAGLGEGLIVNMVQTQPGNYSLTPDDLVKLKTQGVSDKILNAMVTKGAKGAAPAAAAPSTAPGTASNVAPADSDIPPGIEIGVYYRKAGNWEELLPEVVNWKTGGVLKSVASAGIVKGDINGHITQAHSRNSVTSPVEVLIYVPEGVAITEYQLLHLHEEKESREFRTVTGGVLHVSGGATRDVIPFEGKKMANRTYKVLLPNLGAGEYGFLPPGAITSSNSASIGKMYTFRLLE
jgi:hypothetical protein